MLRSHRVVVAVSTAALLAGSCSYQTFTFFVPAQVSLGEVFVIEVGAQVGAGTTAPYPTAVVQLPVGFTVLAATGASMSGVYPFSQGSVLVWGIPVAEPGHQVTYYAASTLNGGPGAYLKLYVRAPSSPGSYSAKIQLGFHDAPPLAGYSSALPWPAVPFSIMTATSYPAFVRNIQVVASPPVPPFTPASTGLWLPGTAPDRIVFGDVTGDGRDDLVEVRNGASPRVYRSVPPGFVDITGNLPAGALAGVVVVGDFDGDGAGDLADTNGNVWFASGVGVWVPGPSILHGIQNAAVSTGDVNGDGRADLAFANAVGCAVYRGNANRTFTSFGNGLPGGLGTATGRAELADLDGDGIDEMLTWSPGVPPSLWRTDGQGNWFVVPSFAMPSSNARFVFLDVDGDGKRDIVRSGHPQAFGYSASGVTPFPISPFWFVQAVAMDHDRDGRDDLVMAVSWQANLRIARNLGGSTFSVSPLPTAQGFHALGNVSFLATGDLDGDSFPDLAAGLDGERPLAWRNTATGAAPFGVSCSAPGFAAPQLTVQGVVGPGQSPLLRLTGALPNGPACFWAGADKRTFLGQPVLPLDLASIGAPTCSLYTEALVLVCVVADATGVASIPIPLPAPAPAASFAVFAQGGVLAPGANALQGLFSNGLAIKIQ